MRAIVLIILLSLSSCTDRNNPSDTNDDIRCIKGMQILPTLDSTGNFLYMDTSTVHIYYRKDKMLFQIENRFAKIRYTYFSTSDLGKTGYYFPDGNVNNAKVVQGESILNEHWFGLVNLDRIFNANHFTLLKSDYDSTTGLIREHYEFKEKGNTTYTRYADLYLTNKMSDLYVQFTHDMDQRRKMRVLKFQLYTPKQFSKALDEMVDEYTLTNIFEDVVLTQSQKERIVGFFK